MIEIRKGQAPAQLAREEFSVRFRTSFIDPAFRAEDQSIARLEEIAWQAYTEGRKAPFTRKAGPGYADPDYQLSVEWIATKQRIGEAQLRWADPLVPSRVLLICGSARNDGTCPGEISKWVSSTPVRRLDWIATSVITSRMRPVTTRWIWMNPCRKKRAVWRSPWRRL